MTYDLTIYDLRFAIMKKLTEKELVDLMAEWVEKRFEETHREIILKGENRDFVIVPYERKIYDKE